MARVPAVIGSIAIDLGYAARSLTGRILRARRPAAVALPTGARGGTTSGALA